MASSFSSPKLIHGFHGPNSCSCIPHFHTIKLGSNRPQTPLSFRYVLKLIPIKFGTDKVLRSSMALISLCLLGYMFVLNIVTILMCSFGLLFTTLQISQAPPRFRDAARLQLRTRLYTVFASNSSPSDGDSSEEKSGGTISSDDARGPPFLTILAGFLVFSLLCWVFGSIIMWLFGLIVKVPLSK